MRHISLVFYGAILFGSRELIFYDKLVTAECSMESDRKRRLEDEVSPEAQGPFRSPEGIVRVMAWSRDRRDC